MNKNHVVIAVVVGIVVGYFFANKLASRAPYSTVIGLLP